MQTSTDFPSNKCWSKEKNVNNIVFSLHSNSSSYPKYHKSDGFLSLLFGEYMLENPHSEWIGLAQHWGDIHGVGIGLCEWLIGAVHEIQHHI